MATLRQKIRAEMKMRELLAENGMPEPDGVEYGHGCIRLFFDEPKVAVVIDIDNPEEVIEDGVMEYEQAGVEDEDDVEREPGYPEFGRDFRDGNSN